MMMKNLKNNTFFEVVKLKFFVKKKNKQKRMNEILQEKKNS